MTAHPTYPATLDGLRRALAALGATAETVAQKLTAGGFTGRPCCGEACPVAHYLTAVIPEAISVRVPGDHADVRASGVPPVRVSVALPPGVAGFITGFDLGGFADLSDEATT